MSFIKTSKVLKPFERIIGVPLPVDITLLLTHQVLEPNSADTYITGGIAYAKNGEYDLAIADFSKAIELEPETLSAYEHRGVVYYNKGRFHRAIDDFSAVISLTPGDSFAYWGARDGLPQPIGF